MAQHCRLGLLFCLSRVLTSSGTRRVKPGLLIRKLDAGLPYIMRTHGSVWFMRVVGCVLRLKLEPRITVDVPWQVQFVSVSV